MSKDNPISERVESSKEYHRITKPLDLNEIEMVFGTPKSPKGNVKPDVHLVTNEKNHTKKTVNNHKNNIDVHDGETSQPTQPLLEPNRDRQIPTLAGPEIDDLDDGKPTGATPYPGIDDGLLEPGEKKPDGTDDDGGENSTREGSGQPTVDNEVGTDDDGVNGLGTRFGIEEPLGQSLPDVNTYQQKKNLAQGMMDLALLSANANQLRYVVESSTKHPYFYPSIVFISLSIILQIAVGVGLIMNSRYNVKDDKDICKADKINNMTVLGVFLVTIVNVFITSFSVATPNTVGVVDGVVVQQAGYTG